MSGATERDRRRVLSLTAGEATISIEEITHRTGLVPSERTLGAVALILELSYFPSQRIAAAKASNCFLLGPETEELPIAHPHQAAPVALFALVIIPLKLRSELIHQRLLGTKTLFHLL